MDTDNSTAITSGFTVRLVPESGATLFRLEAERRKGLRQKGTIPTGCSEIDDVLLSGGGFERGCVTGVSVEVLDFGVLLGLQTIASALVFGGAPDESSSRDGCVRRAAIITTWPATQILPILRDVIYSQAQTKFGRGKPEVEAELRRCLEAISISRIFDIEGLWEVLRELEGQNEATSRQDETRKETPTTPHEPSVDQEAQESESEDVASDIGNETRHERDHAESDFAHEGDDLINGTPLRSTQGSVESSLGTITQLPPLRIGPDFRPPTRKSEILDSEDEEPLSPSPLRSPTPTLILRKPVSPYEERPEAESDRDTSSTPSPGSSPNSEPAARRPEPPEASPPRSTADRPEIILVTHFSALLTALFTNHEKTSAHTTLQELSSYLRTLARSAGPLIMLLNTTTSHAPETARSTSTPADPNRHGPEMQQKKRPLDPTLRSIFNPGPSPVAYGSAATQLARRNKPSFGATFAQLLDLHLLGTRIPRTRDDAEVAISLGSGAEEVRYAWVVEVLLDELGGWDGKGAVNREQRWAAVDVRDGVRVVDAFGRRDSGRDSGRDGGKENRGPVRVVAGFGGPVRV
ncbi:hypothetical protein GGR50DRAFT_687418 [Xylaria sp. CBS 124048]|nr:hypothetical protein GGR50DRAFT_687418 [Xylaria sp. CBS 124048]